MNNINCKLFYYFYFIIYLQKGASNVVLTSGYYDGTKFILIIIKNHLLIKLVKNIILAYFVFNYFIIN